jgi:sulfide:quinone oxidoreductase
MSSNINYQRKSYSRRKFLKIGLAGAAGAVILERSVHYFNQSGAKAKIVIVGGGAAGITMAAYLSRMIRDYDITIIEPNEKHYYQPGYTLIAAGVFTPGEVVKPTKDLIPDHVKWVKDSVTELHPDANTVVTAKEGKFSYDFLVLVPGCQMNFNLVEGISREELGKGNVHSIYDYNSAVRCWDAIKSLPNSNSRRLIFTNTYTKIKCGGAPKKICLITDDHLRKENKRNDFRISYFANQKELMKPKIFGDRLKEIFKERNIETNYCHRLISVDTSAKKAVFMKLPESVTTAVLPEGTGEKVVVDYDLLHIVPPMSAPDFIRNSELSGDPEQGSWVKVDKETMVHEKYKNIICLGDAAGLPTSKTGAAIRKQAPIAAANLISLMEGKVPRLKYDGYSACPIVTEYGKVLMCEFGYNDKLLPTIPFIDPGIERGMWWILKVHGLKPMYYHGMLKGLM